MELPDEIEEVRRIVMQPGDIIVVRYKSHMSDQARDQIAKQLRSVFDKETKIVILDRGMTLDVVAPVDSGREVTR